MTTNYNDRALIDSIKKGEAQAFSAFIEKYKNLVYSLALKMLKNREEAEEVAQDSFIKAFRSINTFKGDSKLSTWIYKIVYYSCLDRLKKNRKQLKNVSMTDGFDISDDEALSALGKMQNEEMKASVARCIEQLHPEDSFLLTLFYFEEMTLEEMSKVVDLKPNHIKVKLFRARKKLSDIFKNNLEPEIIERYERN